MQKHVHTKISLLNIKKCKCMHFCKNVRVHACTYVCVCMYACIHTCIYTDTLLYVTMYGYVDICAHINTHTHTHTYTHTHTPPLLTKQKGHQCARIQLEKKERTSHICSKENTNVVQRTHM